ncbi:MAG: cytochrome c oxidase subunit II [Thermoleophilia bacterium]
MYKSKHILPLVIIGVIVAALTAAQALLIDWLPPATSEQAGRTFTLLWFLFWASAIFFVIVTSVIIYSVWKFRAPKGDLGDGPPIHGNTKLEVVWTTVPSIILVVVAIYGYIVLERNEAVAANAMTVDVYAQQFAWSYGYPDAGIQTGVLVVPQGRQVELHVRARDVIHDFWVPQFGIKGDAVPGIDHVLWINPTTLGTYPVVCAELCGVGHSVMRSKVEVVTPAAFEAWLAKGKAAVADGTAQADAAATAANAPGDAVAGKTIFEAKCGGCHAGLGTEAGGVGPQLKGRPLTLESVKTQITNGKGMMPGGIVSGTDMADVAAYVMSIN